MNADKIKMWTEALRSGDYSQARNALRVDGPDDENETAGFCCLGVACDLALKDGVPIEAVDVGYRPMNNTNVYSGALPPEVIEWLGLTDDQRGESGDFRVKYGVDESDYLAGINDSGDYTFAEIADIIENNFLKEDK